MSYEQRFHSVFEQKDDRIIRLACGFFRRCTLQTCKRKKLQRNMCRMIYWFVLSYDKNFVQEVDIFRKNYIICDKKGLTIHLNI